jgi:hypothetical protein
MVVGIVIIESFNSNVKMENLIEKNNLNIRELSVEEMENVIGGLDRDTRCGTTVLIGVATGMAGGPVGTVFGVIGGLWAAYLDGCMG